MYNHRYSYTMLILGETRKRKLGALVGNKQCIPQLVSQARLTATTRTETAITTSSACPRTMNYALQYDTLVLVVTRVIKPPAELEDEKEDVTLADLLAAIFSAGFGVGLPLAHASRPIGVSLPSPARWWAWLRNDDGSLSALQHNALTSLVHFVV